MNRTKIIQVKDNPDGIYFFGECPHCHEPQGLICQPASKQDIHKCYCRGANGLSFLVSCCNVLNCIKKKGYKCDLIWPLKDSYPAKQYNVIVSPPKEIEI